jgi:hypothetical protein
MVNARRSATEGILMKCLRRMAAAATLSAAVLALVPAHCSATPYEGFADYRTILLSRFDYTWNSPNITAMENQIHTMMQNAANHGFTEIIWQVRGQSDALYNSNVEPRIAGRIAAEVGAMRQAH